MGSVCLHVDIKLRTGQQTSAGRKQVNEDSMGIHIPEWPALTLKGAAAVIADGVSAAEAGREAAEICVKSFLDDYYSAPDDWTVGTSAQKILTATNRWLYGRGQHYPDANRGYVSTLSALVLKSRTAHVFHVGDTRIYRLRDGRLEPLTRDHATAVDDKRTYLTRAMGMDVKLAVDYQTFDLQEHDIFVLTTDGIHDYLSHEVLAEQVASHRTDPQAGCDKIVEQAANTDSPDNLTCQMLVVERLSDGDVDELVRRLSDLPFPPALEVGQKLDGYEVLRILHASTRSHLYLVRDLVDGERLVMKTPSVNFEDDPAYLERFSMEQWIGSRTHSQHLVRAVEPRRPRKFLYNLMEYVDGPTLEQWIELHACPDIQDVVEIVGQVARGIMALHRRETVHQDLKPANIMIDAGGTVKVIDYGSCRVAGIQEITAPIARDVVLGTLQYAAPEYRLGEQGDRQSDLFSLGCIAYEMLTHTSPYGTAFESATNLKGFMGLAYRPAYHSNPLVPLWMDSALRRATDCDPRARYSELSELVTDLQRPNPRYAEESYLPLIERNPVRLWQGISALLAAALLAVLYAWLG